MRVGIVEDNLVLMEDISEKLSKYDNIQIIQVNTNGRACLNTLELLDELPEVVLMDIEMPQLNGIETTEIITKKYPQIDVIMLTVFDDDENIIKSIQAGAKSYLLKTESIDFIIKAIEDVKKGYSQLSPMIARKIIKLMRENKLDFIEKENNKDFEKQKRTKNLTNREQEILEILSQGLQYKAIATKLGIETTTVKKHIRNIYNKLNVHNQIQAIQILKDNQKAW